MYGPGSFSGSKGRKLEHMITPIQAEATSCVKAVEVAAELGLHRVVLESDSQILNDMMAVVLIWRSIQGHITISMTKVLSYHKLPICIIQRVSLGLS